MQPASNSIRPITGDRLQTARTGIVRSVLRWGTGLGTLVGMLAAVNAINAISTPFVTSWTSFDWIALSAGALVGFFLGLLAGLVDGLALRAALQNVLLGTSLPVRAAAASAAFAVLLVIAPASLGLSWLLGPARSMVLAQNIIAWLAATWVGNQVLKSAVERARYETPSPGPSYLDLSLPQPSHAETVETAHAPLSPIAPQLPFTPSPSSPTGSPGPHVPSRHRPSRRPPHPVTAHARS